ncbi:hypothetical protein IFT69_11325 [Pseudomonas putida]|jgi:hypothetical protein|nr:hypothetical protein [Pseudomonas putida]
MTYSLEFDARARNAVIRSATTGSRQTTPSSVLLATERILRRVGLPVGFF